MDHRYQWTTRDGVQDLDGLPKTIGIGIGVENGRIVINTNGPASLDMSAVKAFKADLQWAEEAAARQRGERS